MDTTILQTYLHIVDEGSFAAAARRMGISKSMSSKYIADLETSLGARLLTRSTRSVRPTALGVEYYTKVKDVLYKLEQANEAVRSTSSHIAGPLKIGSPIAYTMKVLQPHIVQFMEDYPDVQLEAVLDDKCSDLIGDGFDAAIRIGDLDDSSLVVRRLHGARIHIVAAPAYLAQHGVPLKPAELAAHRCLHYTNMRGSGTWPFQIGNEITYQKIHPSFSANNGDIIRATAVAGKGLAFMPEFLIEEELRSGQLVPVLADYSLPDVPVNLVYPTRKNMTAALRAFLDFMGGLQLS